ncbi:MAG: hypothetical protein Q7S11_03840 [bacterium]|nr:hypothetical protein [bacterium]
MAQSPKDGTRLAKRSFIVLGIVYIVFAISDLVPSFAIVSLLTLPLKMAFVGAISFSSSPMVSYVVLLAGIVLLVAGYLLAKRNIIGAYLGWVFILMGAIAIFSKGMFINVIPLVILTYLIYVNYRAHKTLRSEQNSIPIAST